MAIPLTALLSHRNLGIVNEPRIMEGTHVLDPQAVQNFYYEAYNVVRNVTGIGEGKGPMIVSPNLPIYISPVLTRLF